MMTYLRFPEICDQLFVALRNDILEYLGCHPFQFEEVYLSYVSNTECDKLRGFRRHNYIVGRDVVDFFTLNSFFSNTDYLERKGIDDIDSFLEVFDEIKEFRNSVNHDNTRTFFHGKWTVITNEVALSMLESVLHFAQRLELELSISKENFHANLLTENDFLRSKLRVKMLLLREQISLKYGFTSNNNSYEGIFDFLKDGQLYQNVINENEGYALDRETFIDKLQPFLTRYSFELVVNSWNALCHFREESRNWERVEMWVDEICSLLNIDMDRLMRLYYDNYDNLGFDVR